MLVSFFNLWFWDLPACKLEDWNVTISHRHIAYWCKQFDQICTTNFYATFQKLYFLSKYCSPQSYVIFEKKNAKCSSAGGSAPQTPTHSPSLRISWLRTWQLSTVFNYTRFCSFCFEQFFLDRSVANLMMLIIDVCLMFNCFLFEKFYLHHALGNFDSILWLYTTLFIHQSIDRQQMFDVTFEISSLKNPAYATDRYYLV